MGSKCSKYSLETTAKGPDCWFTLWTKIIPRLVLIPLTGENLLKNRTTKTLHDIIQAIFKSNNNYF